MAAKRICSSALCISCISVCFLPVLGTLVVTGSSNTLGYQNASMGKEVSGVVSQKREEVWLYSWANKTEVNLLNEAFFNISHLIYWHIKLTIFY